MSKNYDFGKFWWCDGELVTCDAVIKMGFAVEMVWEIAYRGIRS